MISPAHPESLRPHVVIGILHSRRDLQQVITTLQARGFRNADISALIPSSEATRELVHEAATKAPEGTITGMVTGAIVGGTIGWLLGAGTVTAPGIDSAIALNPLISAMAGVGAGSALGGLLGGLLGLRIPEYEAKNRESDIHDEGILLTVHCDDAPASHLAEAILLQHGASDISFQSALH